MKNKKPKIIEVSEESMQEKVASVPFTQRFPSVESTYRIRTVFHEDVGVKVYALELVTKSYGVIQRIHIGPKDTQIKSISAKLAALGVDEEVIKKGIKDFYRKYV